MWAGRLGHNALMRPSGGARLGRPPATDSADTRRRILDSARIAFALKGYGVSTNRSLATDVGVTAGAIYHYFGSKLDLYMAVHDDVQHTINARYEVAITQPPTFRAKLDAVLDVSHELNDEDPTLAQFLGAVRVDMRRHPELAKALKRASNERGRFFDRIVDEGVATGEIAPSDREAVSVLLTAILVGLTDAVSNNNQRHQLAVDAFKALFDGTLVRPPRTNGAAARRTPPKPATATATASKPRAKAGARRR
jgi:AcrR family transcriptional regulator